MKHFALTGGIGSGKSTVLSMFKDLGIPTFSADDSAKHAMQHDSSLIHKIKELLGENAYKNGVLDSAFIAEQVFFDSDKLAALNAIVHPAAKADYASWCKQQTAPYTVYEFPLVFELGAADRFEGVILITSPKEERIQRVQARDAVLRTAVLARMANQWTDEQKIPLADFVIENLDLSKTERHVKDLHKHLLKISAE
jgi:dephospho-CoA kinase